MHHRKIIFEDRHMRFLTKRVDPMNLLLLMTHAGASEKSPKTLLDAI